MTDVTVLCKQFVFSQNTNHLPILNGNDILYAINKLVCLILKAQKHFIKSSVWIIYGLTGNQSS